MREPIGMAIPSKIRQRRWKERQINRRQVTVMLPEETFYDLCKIKELRGTNYSDIVEKAISHFSKEINLEKIKRKKNLDEISTLSTRNDKLPKIFTDFFGV